jgi:formylglycine-generating enzyme required for sulfatase activity
MEYDTADLRRFLVDAFNDEDLKIFCFDYFRDVYDDFTTGMTRGQMIQLLIERCVRRAVLPSLEAALRKERPDQYEKRFGTPEPADIPAETAPAGRDPRQVFISHAHEDAVFAHRLAADLVSAGWRVWIAPDSILPGEKWVEAIGRGLVSSGVFVVVLSPAGVASHWVKTETNAAIELEVGGAMRFIPLDVTECAVPILWNGYQRVSFRGCYEDGLRALSGRLSGAPAAVPVAPTTPEPEAAKPTVPSIFVPAVVSKRGPIEFDWLTIPPGDFLMGSDKQKDKLAFDNEMPQHTLYLPEYRIARTPVTVAQFAAFVKATGYEAMAEGQDSVWIWSGWKEIAGADWAHPRGPKSDVQAKQDHPVTCVSWHDAVAFCKWAAVRLPTEAEWEKAARGTDGRFWPWGNRAPNDGLCNFKMTVGDTSPVGRYPDGKSPYGLLDAAGNVWEWTSSLWGKHASNPEFGYPYDAKDGRENLSTPDAVLRVLRGGSFRHDDRSVRCAFRDRNFPNVRINRYGFRVVSPGF